MTDRTRLPLPLPAKVLKLPNEIDGNPKYVSHYTAYQLREYSDAETAVLRERVRVLRKVAETAAAADVFQNSPGAMDRLAEYARAALEQT